MHERTTTCLHKSKRPRFISIPWRISASADRMKRMGTKNIFCSAMLSYPVGGGRAVEVVAFGHDGCRFQPSHLRPTSPVRSLMLAVFPFLKLIYHVISSIEEVKGK